MTQPATQTATIRVKKVWPPKTAMAPWNISVDGVPSTVRYNVWENQALANALAAKEGSNVFVMWQQGKPYTTMKGVTLDQRNIVGFAEQPKPATQAAPQPGTGPERPMLDTREEDIATLAIFKCMTSWTAQIDYGDAVEGAKMLDACRLMWRMHKTGSHKTVAPVKKEEFPYDDEIPFE